MHRAVQAAGGVSAGMSGQPWVEVVAAGCTTEARPLVSELAVEPMELPRRTHSRSRATRPATWRASIAGVRLALVEAQVAELKSRLQRTNPVEEPDAYHQLFGDLVPLEQYKIALRTQAAR